MTDSNATNLSYLLFEIGGEQFGIDVMQVKDVLSSLQITRVPQSCDQVYGVMNLRGRIVTVINTAHILNIDHDPTKETEMYIVVEHEGEDYALLVDWVEDNIDFPDDRYPSVPRTLDNRWKDLAEGIDPRGEKILLILGTQKLMSFIKDEDILQMK